MPDDKNGWNIKEREGNGSPGPGPVCSGMGAVCQSNFVTGGDLGMLGESESQVHFDMSNQYLI